MTVVGAGQLFRGVVQRQETLTAMNLEFGLQRVTCLSLPRDRYSFATN